MSSADPFSSRFEVFGREPKHLVGEINQQSYEKLKRLLDVGERGDGRLILLRAPRAGFGKTFLLQRLATEFSGTHHFVRVNLSGGRTTDAAHVLEYVLQAFCQVLPESSTLTKLDYLARKILALGLEPLVASGEVPCQDREGALQALRDQPIETFDFHHDRAVTAHWTKSNFEILGPRLAAELGRMSGASLRESSYWVELLFRFATTAPDNVERARLLFETVFRGNLKNQSESAGEERLHGLLALMGSVTNIVLIIDDTEGLSTHPPDALALASFLTNLSQSCPGTLVVLSVNEDIWESAFLPLLPGGLADRLTEFDVLLQPLSKEQACDLIRARAGDQAGRVLEKIEWSQEPLYARQVLKAAADAWDTLDQTPTLAVVKTTEKGKGREEDLEEGEFADELGDLDDVLEEDLADLEDEPVSNKGLVAGALAGAAVMGAGAPPEEPSADGDDGTESVAGARDREGGEESPELVSAVEERKPTQPGTTDQTELDDERPLKIVEEEEKALPAATSEDFANPFAAGPVAGQSPVEDSAAEKETGEELAEKLVGVKAEQSSPTTAGAPVREDSVRPFANEGEVPEPAASQEERPSPFASKSETEPSPFAAKPSPEPVSGTSPVSPFASSPDPSAASSSDPFVATSEASSPDLPVESDNPFFSMREETDRDVSKEAGGPPAHDQARDFSSDGQEESRPLSARPPSEPEPVTAKEEPAQENPFTPKFGQPFAPRADQNLENALAPSDYLAPEQPGAFGESSTDSEASRAGAGEGGTTSPSAGPPSLSPSPEVTADASPPSPGTGAPANPFAAGAPSAQAPGFGPPPVPHAKTAAGQASNLPPSSDEFSAAFRPSGESPLALSPGSPPAPVEKHESGHPPASPFASIGRGASEKNLEEVSSIFAPLRPEEEGTLDAEKLTPLLEDASESASGASAPAAAELTPETPPPVGTPFAAGEPPGEPPSAPPVQAPSVCGNPFEPIARTSDENPFSTGFSESASQAVGPAPGTLPAESIGQSVNAQADAAGSPPSAFSPGRPAMDAPSGFGFPDRSGDRDRQSSKASTTEQSAEKPASPSDESCRESKTVAESASGNDPASEMAGGGGQMESGKIPASEEVPTSPFASVTSPFAEPTPKTESRDECKSTSESPQAEENVKKPVKIEFTTPGVPASSDSPFRPRATPSPEDPWASPFAKRDPAPGVFSARTELPPKKSEVNPPPAAGSQASPFEPGVPPSLETPTPTSSPPPAGPGGELKMGPDLVQGAGFAASEDSESPFQAPKPDTSSPFAAIGEPSSEKPTPFSEREPAGFPAHSDSGSGDQDKVDELLRQFKERYGRK